MSSQIESSNIPNELPIVRSSDYKLVYCNRSRIGFSNADFRINFGVSEMVQNGGAFCEESVSVAMVPHHAKVLASSLIAALKAFEENFGVIPFEGNTNLAADLDSALKEALSRAAGEKKP